MWNRRRFLGDVAAGILMGDTDARLLRVRVTDSVSGLPVAARVRLVDARGKDVTPIGHPPSLTETAVEGDVRLSAKRFCYIDGGFSLPSEALPVRFLVLKGFEYTAAEGVLSAADFRDGTAEIKLERWSSLKRYGWRGGDVHIHHISPRTCRLEMDAEDLDIANILTSDFTADQKEFEGRLNANSSRDRLIYVSQEFRHDHLGHMCLLNLKKLISPVKPMQKEHFPLHIRACDETRAQGGYVAWAHFPSWPGLESPLDVALEKLDGLEILCVLDPREFPVFMREVVPELAANDGLRLWYRYLNCGFQLTATAGTDKMTNFVTVGANRVYAKVEGEFTYAGWIDALKRGRTFVTNSPVLDLRVNGSYPGDRIAVQGQAPKVEVYARAESLLPYDRLEIVANGVVIQDATPSGRRYKAEIQFEYPVERSCWIAARTVEDRATYRQSGVNFREIHQERGTRHGDFFGTRRPESVFAHTTPVYLVHNGTPIRSNEDAAYYIRYLDAAADWLEKNGRFARPSDRKATLEAFESARAAYRARML